MTQISTSNDEESKEASRRSLRFSATRVNGVLRALSGGSQQDRQNKWLEAVAARVCTRRPDIRKAICNILGVEPAGADILNDLSVGEVGVCYEALISEMDNHARRSSGQFFTPDDAAAYMAIQSREFPAGTWLDPCCGVGNLAWHLANIQVSPDEFIKNQLILVDRDEVALRTAVAIICEAFIAPGDVEGVGKLYGRALCRDFLSDEPLPEYDFAILNPPYARCSIKSGLKTASTRETFALFVEKVATSSKGFISVTPASYLSAPKFQCLRDVIFEAHKSGNIFVFDNVPDTLFRGFKYGSTNTSKTNFVRAAITVCDPNVAKWNITPILRWKAVSRKRMFDSANNFLAPMRIGPHGEWAKIPRQLEHVWSYLASAHENLGDLTVKSETPFKLTIALTPRYFISASFRDLERGSKAVLNFATAGDRNRAAMVLNSSVAYFWWRALDGGVTLPKRVINSMPIPRDFKPSESIINHLIQEESDSVVRKLNAGMINENIKRPKSTVQMLDNEVLGTMCKDFDLMFSEDMFQA